MKELPPFEDRDILIALVNAVLSLGEKVTGEKMVLTVWDKDGNYSNVTATGVNWTTDGPSGP